MRTKMTGFCGSEPARSHAGVILNRRQHKGEPRLPFNMSCMLFFYYWRAVYCCFWNSPFAAFFCDPHAGSRANVFFWALIHFYHGLSNLWSNLCGCYLKVVLLFSARLRGGFWLLGKVNLLQKNLLAASLPCCFCYVRVVSYCFYYVAAVFILVMP